MEGARALTARLEKSSIGLDCHSTGYLLCLVKYKVMQTERELVPGGDMIPGGRQIYRTMHLRRVWMTITQTQLIVPLN